jgi:hypothetical protein
MKDEAVLRIGSVGMDGRLRQGVQGKEICLSRDLKEVRGISLEKQSQGERLEKLL